MYSISKYTFWGICILMLALPVSRHWKLLVAGEKVTGTVMEFSLHIRETRLGEKLMQYASDIQFQAGDSTYITRGPVDHSMEPGSEVTIIYNPKDPSKNCLVSFAGFYAGFYTVLPVTLLVIWAAFYMSFNYYTRKDRKYRGKRSGENMRRIKGKSS